MNLLEIIRQAREYLDDPFDASENDEWASDDDGLRWTNKHLTRLCNNGIREAVEEFPIRDTAKLAIVAGTAEYAYSLIDQDDDTDMPDVIISVTGARLDGETYPLVKRDTVWMDSYHPGWRNDADNTPGVFLADVKHRHLHLWHAPSADGTLLLEVERYPLEDLAWSNRLTATPELPERFHRYLPHYIAGHAFQKQDGNTHRSSNAADHLSQWRKAVGGGRSAQQMQERDHGGGRLLKVHGRQW